jgi:hypothetical protein
LSTTLASHENRSGLRIDCRKEDAMDQKTFDDLLNALQSSMITAQEALQTRYEAAIRKIYEMDRTGAARASVLTFAIPGTCGGEEGFKNFSLSVLSFLGQHQPRISMCSLEFKFLLKRKFFAGGTWNYYLIIKKNKYWEFSKKDLHRMVIAFSGTDTLTGQVYIDRRFFMDIPFFRKSQNNIAEEKPFFLTKLFNRVLRLWQPEGFMMTVEQSEKVKDILEHRDHEGGEQEEDTSHETILLRKDTGG